MSESEIWAAAARMQAERDRCRSCPAWDGQNCGGCYLDDDDGPCPDCGFGTDFSTASLVRLPGSARQPCGACLWAYGARGAS